MNSLDMPRRGTWKKDVQQLVKLEAKGGRPSSCPERLGAHNLLVMEALYQPRGASLGFRPGASAKHIEAMANIVREGGSLDPLAIMAFGSRCVLIDGHHRLEAYKRANRAHDMPVKVYDTEEAGEERVTRAIALSMALNAKDKLAMSPEDKSDAAWRMVIRVGDAMSKRHLVSVSAVKERTIGYMRAVAKALLAAGRTPESLYEMAWATARWENERLKGNDSEPNPEADEKRLRHLMKKLAPAINDRLPAALLLEALERLRPGLELELETAIHYAKKGRTEPDG